MGNVTLQTIADELGVSRTTISNAFNRPDQLSDELRRRILEAATKLGYTGPDPVARTLRRGRTGALGLVLKESLAYAFEDPYAIELLASIATETEITRTGLYLIPSPPGTDQSAGVRNAVVDAFCVFALPAGHSVVEAVLARGLATVFIDGPRTAGYAFVGIDDRAAMADVTQHLLDLGHRRLAILTFRIVGDDHVGFADEERLAKVEYRSTAERISGVVETLEAAGLEPIIYEIGLNTRDNSRRGAVKLLDAEKRPTAIICLSDQIALGAIDAARERGISVPEDLSITGFDDIPEAARASLTTIRQPAAEKGRAAARLLQTGDIREEIVRYELVIRASTAKPAVSPIGT